MIWFSFFILVMKYLIVNQNIYKSKLSPLHKFNFLKKHVYVHKAALQIFDIFIKFNYLIVPNILQIVFDLINYSIVS